jgi:hypothetical protein
MDQVARAASLGKMDQDVLLSNAEVMISSKNPKKCDARHVLRVNRELFRQLGLHTPGTLPGG